MPKLKPRHKRRIFWSILYTIAALVLALVIVPPFITINNIKPKLETAIHNQTGMDVKINGGINFSMLGRITITAHNVVIPNGQIDSFQFAIPISKIFNPSSADLSGNLFVNGANVRIDQLTSANFKNKISIRNSVIKFMGNDYQIIQGTLNNGLFDGIVRYNGHKYNFRSDNDEFYITNKNNELEISGNLYSDGTANGILSVNTSEPNTLFNFSEPEIHRNVSIKSKFEWNGKSGFKFYDIDGGDFLGKIEIFDDGRREIYLYSDDINFDISFLLKQTSVFYNTKFNLDLHGRIKLGNKMFNHIKIDAIGEKNKISINKIIADSLIITGGEINVNGAENLGLRLKLYDTDTYCLFSGDWENWKCSKFTHGNFYGNIDVYPNKFELFVKSDSKMPTKETILKKLGQLGKTGFVNFEFADAAGKIYINDSTIIPKYEFVKNKTLNWLGVNLYFLPDSLKTEIGDFTWTKDDVFFQLHSGDMNLTIGPDYFTINGTDIKDWFPKTDLQFLNNNLAYTISGNYKDQTISNLKIKVAGHVFTGSAIDNNITLKTDLLNFDTFTNQEFIDNFEENQFLHEDPLMIPFDIGLNLSLSADMIIYNGNQFTNFVYSLKSRNEQTFSISDSMHGNLLANINKNKNNYDIILQLNRFDISDKLLSTLMPLNIENTTITAQAELNTSGKIAYDIWNNLSGNIDMSFDGGILTGLGVDSFYANSENITTMTAENMLSMAIESGRSKIMKIRMIGTYDHGNFTSTKQFVLSMHHADAVGNMKIINGKMYADMKLILRGTSPSPDQISIEIQPDGNRVFSLSQIMTNFDPDFLRDFSKSHEKF